MAHAAVVPPCSASRRDSVGDRVETARPVFHLEVEAEELADPLVLGNSIQALVQQKLQAVVVSAYQKVAAP